MSDAKRVKVASDPMREPFDLARWRARLDELEETLVAEFEAERLPTDRLQLRRSVDLQLSGQVHAVRVPVEDTDLDADDGGEGVIARFVELYEEKYGAGTAYRQARVQVMTFAVEAVASLPVPAAAPLPDEGADAAHSHKGERSVYVPGSGFETVPVIDAERLRPGNELVGPAVVEAEDTTVFVHPGRRLRVDGFLDLRIDLS
jgi:N-methylhydantoinase A